MNVLVIGGGGREHALVWKIAQNPKVQDIFCAPGNAGIEQLAECLPISAEDVEELLAFALENDIDFTVVGPEVPLCEGIVDKLKAAGLRIFGPSAAAAQLEGSKSFAKTIMDKAGVPTAEWGVFGDAGEALVFAEKLSYRVAVKADGLAAGKGVILCHDKDGVEKAIQRIMIDKEFKSAGDKVIIEELLEGEEASFLAFTDGKTVLPLPTSQDHKPVFDDDEGPNTGGMGAYSPAPVVTPALEQMIMNKIMIPMVHAMADEGHPYEGVLYAGLMIKGDKVKVLEFNCRFGDPETQPILMRLQTDLVEIMQACIDGRLSEVTLAIDPRSAVCVVMASGGYPGSYEKGHVISGLDIAGKMKDVVVFHAGTAEKDGKIVTSGGRVLGVTAMGDTIEEAQARSYDGVELISWDGGAHYRTDIADKALDR